MQSSRHVERLVVHTDGTIVYASEPFLSLMAAANRDEIIGRPLSNFLRSDDRTALLAQFDRLTSGDAAALGMRIDLQTLAGERRPAVVISSAVEWDGEDSLQTTVLPVGEADQSNTALHEMAMHRAPIGITIATAADDNPLIYVNDQFIEETGYSREEVLGRNCRFLQGPQTRSEPVAKLRTAIETETSVTVELRNYRKNGSMFWNRVTLSPVEAPTGEVTHFLGFQEDVSDKKIYEHETTLFKRKAEASEQVMFVTDQTGTIEYVNPAFERTTGYSAREAIGQNPRILKSGSQDETFYKRLWGTITAGEVWEAELVNETKTGERYHVRQKIIPITDDRETITHFTAIEENISDQQLTEQVIDVLNRVLRHNLRSSINVISGHASVLESALEDPVLRASAAAISNRAADMENVSEQAAVVRDLLQNRQDPHQLALSEIEQIVKQCRLDHEEATIDFRIEVGDVEQQEIAIKNGGLLQLAIHEALENAIAHNDTSAPTVEIVVSHPGESGRIRIDIADNGPGIPTDEWNVITSGMETPLAHGSGIGLWIIHWSITVLGGSVRCSANEPRGSIVSFHLPTVRNDY